MDKDNRKTKKLVKKIILVTLWLITLVGILVEGCLYSYNGGELGTGNGLVNFALSFLNIFKILQTDSNVEINNLYENIPTWMFIWYIIANILAPILVADVVIGYFTKWKNWINWLLKKSRKPKILVFGQLEFAKKLAEDNEDCQVIYYANDDDMPDNVVELLSSGVRVSSLPDDINSIDEIHPLAKGRANKVKQIFVCYEQDYDNKRAFEAILKVIEGRKRADKNYEVTIFSDDTDIKYQVLEKLDKQSPVGIVCESEALMPAKNIVTETLKVCYEKNKEFGKKSVSGIITGLGTYGCETLAMAINLCTLSKDSHICFEVVDVDIYKKMCVFLKKFDVSVAAEVKKTELEGAFVKECYELLIDSKNENKPFGQIDGELRIRFYDAKVDAVGFEEVVRNILGHHDIDFVISCDEDMVRGTKVKEVVNKELLIMYKTLIGKEPVYAFSVKDGYVINNVQAKGLFSLKKREEIQKNATKYKETYDKLSDVIYARSNAEKVVEPSKTEKKAKERPDKDYIKRMEKADNGLSAFMQALYWADVDSYTKTISRPSVESALNMSTEEFMKELSGNPDLEEIIATEHRRWCYCQLLRGYSVGAKSKIGKKHNLLVTNDEMVAEASKYGKGTNERIDAVVLMAYDLIPYCVNKAK